MLPLTHSTRDTIAHPPRHALARPRGISRCGSSAAAGRVWCVLQLRRLYILGSGISKRRRGNVGTRGRCLHGDRRCLAAAEASQRQRDSLCPAYPACASCGLGAQRWAVAWLRARLRDAIVDSGVVCGRGALQPLQRAGRRTQARPPRPGTPHLGGARARAALGPCARPWVLARGA
eukprot:4928405-Pleurochrysis_carterae.AAC.1